MKKLNIKALSLGVAAAVITSGSAFAAAPGSGFDTWSSTTAGTITAPCPAGFTCTDIATDNGFLQRQLTDGVSTFVQSVLLEANTNGTFAADAVAAKFADESYIKMTTPGSGGNGNTQGGLANKSKIGDTGFTQNTELLIGSFFDKNNAADKTFAVDQVVAGASNAGTSSTDFFTSFNFSQITTAMAGDTTVTESSTLQLASLTADAVTGEKQAFNFSRSTDIPALQTAFNANPLNVNATAITGPDLTGAANFETIWVGQNFGSQAFGLQDARTKASGGAITSLDKQNSFSSVGFSGTAGVPLAGAAGTGFDWNTALGQGVYAPKF